MFRHAILLLLAVSATSATLGFDAEQVVYTLPIQSYSLTKAISTSVFTCLKGQGYSFYISRIWRSNGAFDNTGVQNIKVHLTGASRRAAVNVERACCWSGTCRCVHLPLHEKQLCHCVSTGDETATHAHLNQNNTIHRHEMFSLQVEAAINSLKSSGASIGQIWLDVEVRNSFHNFIRS